MGLGLPKQIVTVLCSSSAAALKRSSFPVLRLSADELYPNRVLQDPGKDSVKPAIRKDEILQQLERLSSKAEQDGDLEPSSEHHIFANEMCFAIRTGTRAGRGENLGCEMERNLGVLDLRD